RRRDPRPRQARQGDGGGRGHGRAALRRPPGAGPRPQAQPVEVLLEGVTTAPSIGASASAPGQITDPLTTPVPVTTAPSPIPLPHAPPRGPGGGAGGTRPRAPGPASQRALPAREEAVEPMSSQGPANGKVVTRSPRRSAGR